MFLEMGLLFIMFGLPVLVLVAKFVYEDAKDRNMNNPGLWALLVFLFTLLGLVLYLLLRKEKNIDLSR
jgi:Na+-driven multidrug efflux pump